MNPTHPTINVSDLTTCLSHFKLAQQIANKSMPLIEQFFTDLIGTITLDTCEDICNVVSDTCIKEDCIEFSINWLATGIDVMSIHGKFDSSNTAPQIDKLVFFYAPTQYGVPWTGLYDRESLLNEYRNVDKDNFLVRFDWSTDTMGIITIDNITPETDTNCPRLRTVLRQLYII